MDNSLIYGKQVRKLILDTGLPLKEAANGMGLTSGDFLQWWNDPHRGLKLSHLDGLSQFLYISDKDLVSGEYDTKLIRRRIFEGPHALPERYTLCPFSYTRASAHIVEYIALTRGRHFADKVLRRLNVSPISFDNLDNRVNILLFTDLFYGLSRYGFPQKELDYLGQVLFLSITNTPLGEKFGNAKNYHECYRVVADNLCSFDENFIYDCRLEENSFTFIARFNLDKIGDLNISPNSLEQMFKYRRTVVEWFPLLSKLPPVKAKIKKCISRGDNSCIYHFDFSGYRRSARTDNLLSLFS